MPNYRVEYLSRPVRIGRDERQKKILREAAGRMNSTNPLHKRAMLIIRLNQQHTTLEQARAQFDRIHQGRRTLHRWPPNSKS